MEALGGERYWYSTLDLFNFMHSMVSSVFTKAKWKKKKFEKKMPEEKSAHHSITRWSYTPFTWHTANIHSTIWFDTFVFVHENMVYVLDCSRMQLMCNSTEFYTVFDVLVMYIVSWKYLQCAKMHLHVNIVVGKRYSRAVWWFRATIHLLLDRKRLLKAIDIPMHVNQMRTIFFFHFRPTVM